MKVYQISEVINEVGMIVPCMDLKVKKLWEVKEGVTGKGRKWKLQGGIVTDGTTESKVTFWDRENVPTEGNRVYVHSVMGKQGLSGISIKEEEYQGKSTKSIHISKSARIEPFGATPTSQAQVQLSKLAENSPQKQSEEFKPKSSNTATWMGPGLVTDLPKVDVDAKIQQYRNLYKKCFIQARTIDELTEVLVKDIASCFFIQAVKDGLLNHIEVERKTKEWVQDHPEVENQLETSDIPF